MFSCNSYHHTQFVFTFQMAYFSFMLHLDVLGISFTTTHIYTNVSKYLWCEHAGCVKELWSLHWSIVILHCCKQMSNEETNSFDKDFKTKIIGLVNT